MSANICRNTSVAGTTAYIEKGKIFSKKVKVSVKPPHLAVR